MNELKIRKSKEDLKQALAKTSKPTTNSRESAMPAPKKPSASITRASSSSAIKSRVGSSVFTLDSKTTRTSSKFTVDSKTTRTSSKPPTRDNTSRISMRNPSTPIKEDQEGKVTVSKIVSKNNIKQDGVNAIKRVRLDRQNIVDVSGLSNLLNLTHLYLQYNNISEFPDLNLPNLDFLILSHNKLEKISLTKCNLNLLDLEANQFKETSEINLPTSIEYFVLRGNKCCEQIDYRIQTISKFPNIRELDEVEVSNLEKRIVNKRMQLE
ncbi:hypothetical protein HDV01_005068 [Terramyces sp. JEL0728]|nr:hypothetical protein HDV01_005068 [Terramyces sp. JEL0728]